MTMDKPALQLPINYFHKDDICDFYIDDYTNMNGRYYIHGWRHEDKMSRWKIENNIIYYAHYGQNFWSSGEAKGIIYDAKPHLLDLLTQFDKYFLNKSEDS